MRGDRGAAGRQLAERAHVEVAVDRHGHRARDRGGRHDQHVRAAAPGLLAQRVALLDPEPVLLVDHHQPQVAEHHLIVEPDPVIQERVRADHDAGRPGGHVVQGRPARLGPLRPGEQGHPGGMLRAVQFPGPAERAEQLADGAVVLLGQDLGGGEQGRLPAVVDDLEHGPDRHQRLAGAHFALQQAVHGVLPAQRGGDLLARGQLALGQRERQPGVERLEQAAAPRDARGGRQRVLGPPPLGQHGLEHERLVPLQPQPGGLDVRELHRAVDAVPRGQLALQAVAGADLGGQRVVGDVERVQHGPHRLGDLPGRQVLGGRVHRDDLGRVLGGHLGARVRGAEQLAVGVDELALAAVGGHLAGEQAVQPGLHVLLAPRLAEEGEGQRARGRR